MTLGGFAYAPSTSGIKRAVLSHANSGKSAEIPHANEKLINKWT